MGIKISGISTVKFTRKLFGLVGVGIVIYFFEVRGKLIGYVNTIDLAINSSPRLLLAMQTLPRLPKLNRITGY